MYAFVNHLADGHVAVPLNLHADLEKDHHHTGVLADRTPPFGAHAGVDQNLRHGVFGGRVLFLLPGLAHGL